MAPSSSLINISSQKTLTSSSSRPMLSSFNGLDDSDEDGTWNTSSDVSSVASSLDRSYIDHTINDLDLSDPNPTPLLNDNSSEDDISSQDSDDNESLEDDNSEYCFSDQSEN